MEEKKTSTEAKKKTKKTKKKQFKFKPVYIILIVFVICVLAFAYYLFSATNSDGPVYGNRCASMVELPDDVLTQTKDEFLSKDEITSINIEKACRTLKIDIDFAEGTTTETIQDLCQQVLFMIDEKAGYSKNNESDTYSYLFTTHDDVQQYHVDFTLRCEGNEDFPAFATKHPQHDDISYTLSSIKNQEIVDQLQHQGEEPEAEPAPEDDEALPE